MSSGPAVVMVLEGDNAIARYRELMGATNFEEAAEVFNYLLSIEKGGELYQKLGFCYQKQGDFKKALGEYKKAELFDINRKPFL